MRIVYVSQYFPPEMGAPSARVHELAREWVRLGHEVTVVTAFPHHPTGVKRPEDRHVLTRRERHDGIDVVRTYVWAAANRGTAMRMVSYASFMASAATIGRARMPRADVVIATTPQLLCAVAGYGMARTSRTPFVLEVRDLWPESLLAVDAMGENAVVRGLRRVAAHLYEHADRVVTVGEGYRRKIHELYGLPLDRMDVIPNGIDTSLFVPGPRDNEVRRQHGWGDKFVILYLGTHGMAHALDKVLEVARTMQSEPDKHFVFVGEGAEKERLRRLATAWRLPNVEFIDQQPKSRVPLYYAACDLGLVTLRDTPLFQEVLPSKIFEYLGMERPIVLAVGGEARSLVESAGAGRYVPPEDVGAMTDVIRTLSSDRAELADMGRRGRSHVLEHYDRSVLARRYLEVLRGGSRAPSGKVDTTNRTLPLEVRSIRSV